MDFFRSADMELYEVSIPKDSIWETMDAFGRLESLHLIDLNKDTQVFNLVYANRVKRWDESLRKITNQLEMEAARHNMPMKIPYNLDSLNNAMLKQSKFKRKSAQMIFETIEEEIKKQAQLIEDQKIKEEQMHHDFMYYLEKKAVLKVVDGILHFGKADQDEENKYNIKMREGDQQFEAREELLGQSGLRVAHMTGTVLQSEKSRIQRLVFRATRGTALIYFKDIQQPIIDYKGIKHFKTVYVVIYQEGEYYEEKLTRILDSFMGNRFDINNENYNEQLKDTVNRISDIK